eukprot:gnl/TRDRNA2_/TRDRNA2_47091_c0_seq2.p1 gnl/TRDRNA2_/TRDRNA2_47091_c0~~gnl/TRDRNA2_/TRDRNA2_47091_c0_seq2.p1  ORF type:complete len:390 (+),score=55.37 gnl/TRDRNA2_/TRDRNA2_47091_c0_seq2:17-1186(+)
MATAAWKAWVSFVPLAVAFTCYPEYSFSWCDNTSEASCIHDYSISVGHFQRKLTDFYLFNRRPPLTEAFFLVKLPRPYQMQFLDSGCNAPMILAYLLVAEAKLPMDDDALQFYTTAQSMVESTPEALRQLLWESSAWPFREAVARFERTYNATYEAAIMFPTLFGGPNGAITIEIVVVHCREDLGWLEAELLPIAPRGSGLLFYEKCGQTPELPGNIREKFSSVSILPCPDPQGGPRGDECLGYLSHIVPRYNKLATFTVFLQADPHEHLHFSYLKNAFAMMEKGTYAVPFLSLNGARHTRTMTPCLSAVHQAIFGGPMPEPVGPYCCAQFIVQDAKVRERPLAFYQNMLRLVDGSLGYDVCTPGTWCSVNHTSRLCDRTTSACPLLSG